VKRSIDQIQTEIEFLKNLIKEKFNHDLIDIQFEQKLTEIINERIEDYVYQRYRDWDTLELFALIEGWKESLKPKPVEVVPEPVVEVKRKTSKSKVV
jgi:hypothetical protein